MFKNYFIILFAIICLNQVFAATIKDGFTAGNSFRESENAQSGHTLGNSFRESGSSGTGLSGTSSRESGSSGTGLSGTSSRESDSSGTGLSGTSSRESGSSGTGLSGTSSRESGSSGTGLSGTSSRESGSSGTGLSGTSSRESGSSETGLSGTSSRESGSSGTGLSGSSIRSKKSADSIQTDDFIQSGYTAGNKPREGLTKQTGYTIGYTARDSKVVFDNLKDVPLIQPKGSVFNNDNFASIPVDKIEFEKSSMKVKRDTQSNTEQPTLKDAVDVVDDENTNKPLSVETSTSVAPKEEKQFYMCLIYCSCGCIDSHCCSGCKSCTNDQLNSLFLSNTNPSDSTNLSAETTTAPPS